MNSILEIKAQIAKIDKALAPLNKKRALLHGQLVSLRNDASKEFVATLPKTVEEYTSGQLGWLLYHWHDQTQAEYDAKYAIYNSLGIFTTGIFAGDKTKQYKFLATINWFPGFIKFYKLAKKHFKTIESLVPEDNTQVILLDIHYDMFGYEGYELQLEIDVENDRARFVAKFPQTSWMSFEEVSKTLRVAEDRKYESDED